MDKTKVFEQVLSSFMEPEIREWKYYPDFRRQWEPVLKNALQSSQEYFPAEGESILRFEHSFAGIDAVFHIDQLKIADWYQKDCRQKKRVIFLAKRFKRDRKGIIRYDESVCDYDPALPEAALTEADKNIIAAAFPGLPPRLSIVYGNKWVDSRFNRLNQTRLNLFLIGTDFVPAFMATAFEVCLYLFMMDLCILKQNHATVKPDELKPLLHIFRKSPMLRIKGLL